MKRLNKYAVIALILTITAATGLWVAIRPASAPQDAPSASQSPTPPTKTEADVLKAYLIAKQSPLSDYSELLLEQENWRLLVAISNIESQFCKRKVSFNCWGIGGDSAYKHYSSYEEAIEDADAFIEKWHARGKWQTVEEMNCSYVVPCSANWVSATNATLKDLAEILPL